ncbi:MAG: lamin tail domain-containing protein [Prevotellaceae bacterium]|jgi:hypothetical protein|nr:lamin tail domain-containing protein [Prevotellaceae bacterium]
MKKIFYFTMICLFAATAVSCLKDQPPVLPETGDSPIKINEAYSRGEPGTVYEFDWVELYNNSDEAVDVSGYVLYDKIDKTDKVVIPTSTIIAARAFLFVEVVDADGNGFGLSSGGDMVFLDDAAGLLIDQIEFGALTPDQSYARNPDGSDIFKIQTPTPNASNSGMVAQPLITNVSHAPASPTNDEDVTVSATVTAGEGTLASVKVQWTLDDVAQPDIAMTNTGGDDYSAEIARQAAGSEVAYSVVAVNSAGGSAGVSGSYTVRDAAVIDYTGLVINEIDGNGKFIELYNNSATEISLAGVTLVKNEGATWWTGGAVSIAAGGYYVISNGVQAGITADETTGASGISPKQNLKFELKDPDANELDAFIRTNGTAWGDGVNPDYGSGTKYSFSRCPDGSGAFGLAIPSCGVANPFMPEGAIATNGSAVNYADLVINEIDGNGKFVEIYNNGTGSISLEGVILRKNESQTWWTGGTVSIAAGGYYTISQNGQNPGGQDEATGASGISPKQNLKFELIAPFNMFIDAFVRTNGGDWGVTVTPDYGSGTQYSFSRCPDGSGAFGLAIPSCNSANPATSAGDIETN